MPEKALYWKQQDTLLIADLHLGKITHFRKAGIAVPDAAAVSNFKKLQALLQKCPARQVIFLGDLFHSELNTEWLTFKELIKKHPDQHFHLITGNHDILHHSSYLNAGLIVHHNSKVIGPIILSHEPLLNSTLYNLCGHIHPGVRVVGAGRQSLRLPCFFFGRNSGILPAFGEFTGLHLLQPQKEDNVFMIAGNQIIDGSLS